jgi:transposase InsO family protein
LSIDFTFQGLTPLSADTERVMRTIKEDIVWPYEWDNPFDFEIALAAWINRYNTDYPHQALGNLTPRQFYEKSVIKEPINPAPVTT